MPWGGGRGGGRGIHHMSHDLGAVTIFRFLELGLGLGLGLD